uniref:hypothetical protein n=1 Tax=Streptomyces corallincola TaxID=2851888 RepID=UPI0027E2A99D|nr:hypothetical protein [Streptomyces corallincola]
MSPRLRSALSAVLIVLACLLVPFGALAAWAAYGLTDTGRYVTTMAPLAADPAVREAVADTVGDGILRQVDRRTDVRPVRASVDPFVHDAVRSFTETQAFRLAWDTGNRVTHDAVLRALRGGDGAGDATEAGAVTIDFAPVAAEVKQQLTRDHVPLAARIPVEHRAVTLLPAGEVSHLRRGYHVLEVAGFWLPVSAVAFAVAGIALAVRRRRAVTATALGTALGGALLALALAVGRDLTLSGLPADIPHPAAGAVYDALTATLRTAAWLLLTLGATVALATWLTRRRRGTPLLPAAYGATRSGTGTYGGTGAAGQPGRVPGTGGTAAGPEPYTGAGGRTRTE